MSFFGKLFGRPKPVAAEVPDYAKPRPTTGVNPAFTKEQMKLRMDRYEADARRNGDMRGVQRAQAIKRVWGV